MPFATHFEDTYYLGILPSVEKASAVCVRVDQNYYAEHILSALHNEIERSDLVIADVTEGNPNVTYELGYAHALKKPTILLSATPSEMLPFDIRQWPTVLYAGGQIHRLKSQLELLVRQLLAKQTSAAHDIR